MADKEITCTECNLYLGVIRDAKLRVGISFLCGGCETSRKALIMKEGAGGYGTNNPFGDVFGDTFNEIFGAETWKK